MAQYKIGEAVKLFLEKSRLNQGVKSIQINDLWREIMGNTIFKYTKKLELVQHTLFIYTDIAPLKHELNFQKKQIIARLNEKLGEGVIREVIIH